jgi:hypothetical protein
VSRILRSITALSFIVAAIAGCGGDKAAYCQDQDDLRASIDQLKDVDVGKDGLGAVKAQFDDVQAAATTLVGSAKQEFAPQTEALKGAAATLGTAVETATSDPSGQSLATVVAGVSGVQAAFKSLASELDSKC